jgi:CRP-like cAMP-binding protein
VRQVTFWEQLDAADRDAVIAIGRTRAYRAGEVLFIEGDEAHHVLVVLSGRLKLTRSSLDGREVLIELRGPGELIGEMGSIDDSPRSATATVTEPVEAVVVPAGRFRQLLIERGSVAFAVLSSTAARLREANERRLEAGGGASLGRLCGRLVELAAGCPPAGDGAIDIVSPLTQQELAEWIGVSRDAVVLGFRRLRELGWVETGRRRIRILDIEALRRAAVRG